MMRLFSIGCLAVAALPACKKYLNASPDASLVIPRTVEDLQGLLNYSSYMNIMGSEGGEIAADNYFLTNATYAALPTQTARDAYLWKPGIFDASTTPDWENEYTVVYNANVVLDNIGSIARTSSNAVAWDNCKGQALVFRGKTFLEVASIWAKGYDSSTASSTLGIPLRLTADFSAVTTRASLADTYQQIISDLKSSIPLLSNFPPFIYNPSKMSAYGYLARAYLAVHDYSDARLYADSCLQLNGNLVDFNTLNPNLPYPFASMRYTNPELAIFTTTALTNYDVVYLYERIDTTLYQSYDSNDLRKTVYFRINPDGYPYFRGSYRGLYVNFNGVAADEMYLIRAEGEARAGDVSDAMSDLNTLLANRWIKGTFVPYTSITADSALSVILTERRKELINRMTRFTDIKRLNLEGANITVTRIVNGQTYTLPPNDPRYALPIPEKVIQASGIQQN